MPDDNEPSPVQIVLEELVRTLDRNGNTPVAEWRRTQAHALKVLLEIVAPLPEKVARMERKNILMLAEKHPIAAMFCVGLFFFMLELWHSAVWRTWLYALLGMPTP